MSVCPSCGMPLEPESSSRFDPLYCIYCQDQINGELKTFEQVRAGCIQAAIDMFDKTEAEAISMVDAMLPHLPRWQHQKA